MCQTNNGMNFLKVSSDGWRSHWGQVKMSAYSLYANRPIPQKNRDPDATNHNACANNKVADEVFKFVKQ